MWLAVVLVPWQPSLGNRYLVSGVQNRVFREQSTSPPLDEVGSRPCAPVSIGRVYLCIPHVSVFVSKPMSQCLCFLLFVFIVLLTFSVSQSLRLSHRLLVLVLTLPSCKTIVLEFIFYLSVWKHVAPLAMSIFAFYPRTESSYSHLPCPFLHSLLFTS